MSFDLFLPHLRSSVPLASRTSLGLGGAALHFAEVDTIEGLAQAFRWAETRSLPVVVLGGGSNVLVADAGLEALVLRPTLRGLELLDLGGAPLEADSPRGRGGSVCLRVAAGERWEDVVDCSLGAELSGIECLAGIPGDAGATPIQNVGAYGQEVAQVLERVHLLDRKTGGVEVIDAAQCGFGYRDSIFKTKARDRWLVTGLELQLRTSAPEPARYPELAAALGTEPRSVREIARTVRELRRRKSMLLDPLDENGRSAGSFFTNPVVNAGDLPALEARAAYVLNPGEVLPRWPAEAGRIKLSAAWLIERAGFAKGTREGSVGISTRHSLALVAHPGATSSALLSFARRVRDGVRDTFGVELQPEPVLLGFGEPF